MIIDPFLNNPKKLDYQLSNSIYKPKNKKKMNKKEFREDAFQTIRDLISDEIPLNEMKNQLENTYPEVHPHTLYKWIKIVKKEPKILNETDERYFKKQQENEEKILFKKRLYQDAKNEYEKAKRENTNPKLIMQLRQECRSWLK